MFLPLPMFWWTIYISHSFSFSLFLCLSVSVSLLISFLSASSFLAPFMKAENFFLRKPFQTKFPYTSISFYFFLSLLFFSPSPSFQTLVKNTLSEKVPLYFLLEANCLSFWFCFTPYFPLSLSCFRHLLPFSQLLPRSFYEGRKLLKKTLSEKVLLKLPSWTNCLSFCLSFTP